MPTPSCGCGREGLGWVESSSLSRGIDWSSGTAVCSRGKKDDTFFLFRRRALRIKNIMYNEACSCTSIYMGAHTALHLFCWMFLSNIVYNYWTSHDRKDYDDQTDCANVSTRLCWSSSAHYCSCYSSELRRLRKMSTVWSKRCHHKTSCHVKSN